jgi:hypothetical protein
MWVDMKPVYEGNPKHKAPWQPGRKGSLCPTDVSVERARELLQSSFEEGKMRFAADNGRAFSARLHDTAKNRWHGYPVAWKEVPAPVRTQLLKTGAVTGREIKRFWEGAQ